MKKLKRRISELEKRIVELEGRPFPKPEKKEPRKPKFGILRKLPLCGKAKGFYFESPANLSKGFTDSELLSLSKLKLVAVEWYVDDPVRSIKLTFEDSEKK